MRQLSILTETLSAGSPVAGQLAERGVQLISGNLAAGNYLITNSCAVLHLSMPDFARWIIDKTVFRRITEFKRAIAEPIVIVEGSENPEVRNVSPAALKGALAFIAVHNRMPVLFAADAKESADLIYAMANQVQNGMGVTLNPDAAMTPAELPSAADEHVGGNGNGNGDRPDSVVVDLPEQIVRMIPEIGPVAARALLKRFGNLRGVFGASAQDLTKIDGIGPKRAKKVASFLSRRETR